MVPRYKLLEFNFFLICVKNSMLIHKNFFEGIHTNKCRGVFLNKAMHSDSCTMWKKRLKNETIPNQGPNPRHLPREEEVQEL